MLESDGGKVNRLFALAVDMDDNALHIGDACWYRDGAYEERFELAGIRSHGDDIFLIGTDGSEFWLGRCHKDA